MQIWPWLCLALIAGSASAQTVSDTSLPASINAKTLQDVNKRLNNPTQLTAQSADSLAGKLSNFPSRLFGKIHSQSTSLNQQVTRQTQQYLAKMARNEQRMQQKLASVDSNAAKSLFAGSQQQYTALSTQIRTDTGRRKVILNGQYQPNADTLQGALAFLQLHPQLLSGAGGGAMASATGITNAAQARLQSAASQFQGVQAKLQDADIVKAYMAQRQQMIGQYLAAHPSLESVLGKQYSAMNQRVYYYSQQVQQYKAMLNDPGAMAQKALAVLGQVPTFQAFMANHSQLGSLFHLPGNYSSLQNVSGLQSKEQVSNIVKGQISSTNTGGAAALQSNLQSAQSQLDGYKAKLSSLGAGNGDAQMPDFKPNDQKTKSFFGRLQYSFNFQTTHNSYYYPSLLSLGLGLGYKITSSNVVGIGLAYTAGTGNGIQHIALTSNGLGLRSYLNIKIKGSLSATGGFEYNYTTPFTSYQQLRQIQYWQKSGLIGIMKTISTKSKVLKQTTLSLLWDCLSYYQKPPTSPFLLRMGYTL